MSDNGKNGSELGRIGQRRYGGVIYEEFLPELNSSIIEEAAKKHRKSGSDHGHWIYPGTTITIPAA